MVVTTDKYKLTRCTPFALKVRRVYFLCNRKLRSYYTKRSAGMRTAAYNADVESDRRKRKNVPRHILCSVIRIQVSKHAL